MASIKQEFAASAAITITLASLANGNARECLAVDNSANKYIDALIQLQIKMGAGTPSSDQCVNIYAYGSEDGTNYTDNASGTDANITLRAPSNLRLIHTIFTPTSGALTYKSNPFAIAWAFGGILPRKWGIVVENRMGIAFDATEGSHVKTQSGIYRTVA